MVLQNFIVEGDAKICFDAINDGTTVCPWIFSNLIHNITNCRSLLFLVIFVGQKESKCFSFIFCMPLSDPLTVVIRTLFLNLFGVCRRRMSVVVHLFVLNEIGIFFLSFRINVEKGSMSLRKLVPPPSLGLLNFCSILRIVVPFK